jgi:cadmium resistance protein CadD (predicted permease)
MESLLALLGIAIVLFVATNIDDIFVLLGFLSDPKFTTRQIAWGQCVGLLGLYGVSVIASLLSLIIPAAYIGLLGLFPIAIGIKQAWELLRGDGETVDDEGQSASASTRGNVLAVAAVTVANGGDNISIYVPVFATRTAFEVVVIGLVFLVMTAIWLVFAHWLTNHRTLGAPIRRYGQHAMPAVLVVLGIWILYEAGTFALIAASIR